MTIALILWLFWCFLVGKMAEKKGRGFWPYVLLSVIISPIGGFIVLLVAGKKKVNSSLQYRPSRNVQQKTYGLSNTKGTSSIYSNGINRSHCSSEKHGFNKE